MALTRRNAQDPLIEPLYEFKDVPRCNRDLGNSVVIKIKERDDWMRMLPELLLLCNEAQNRFDARCHAEANKAREKGGEKGIEEVPPELTPIHTGKALSLEYITDRMDLDDPLHGYVVRSSKEMWMQGFITISTFTSWQRWFRWDSLVDEAGVLMWDSEGAGLDGLHSLGMHADKPLEMRWWMDRNVDASGLLSAMLNAEVRDGDPDGEGVIWPHVAELSLLGGVGCGSFLVNLIIEELESPESPYNFIVMQATENSVPFYEKHGFVRVGAVARYFEKPAAGADADSTEDSDKSGKGPHSPVGTSPVKMSVLNGQDDGNDSKSSDANQLERKGIDNENASQEAKPLRPRRNLAAATPQQESRSSIKGQDRLGDSSTPSARSSRSAAAASAKNSKEADVVAVSEAPTAIPHPSTPAKVAATQQDTPGSSSITKRVISPTKVEALPTLNGSSSKFEWYQVKTSLTPTIESVAKKFGVLTEDLVFMNRRIIQDLCATTPLAENAMLRIPVFPTFYDPILHKARCEIPLPVKSCDTKPMVTNDATPGNASSNGLWYCARDNETPKAIGQKLGIKPRDIIKCNAKLYPELLTVSPLMEKTLLRLPRPPKPMEESGINEELAAELERTRSSWAWGSDDSNQVNLSDVMTYRHWAFSDDPVDYSVASYMMVRPLNKRSRTPASCASPVKPNTPRKGNAGAKGKGRKLATKNENAPKLKYAELAAKRHGGDVAQPLTFAYGADAFKCLEEVVERINKDPEEAAKEARERKLEREQEKDAKMNKQEYPKSIKVSMRCGALQKLRDRPCPRSLRQGPLLAAARLEFDCPSSPPAKSAPSSIKPEPTPGTLSSPPPSGRKRLRGAIQGEAGNPSDADAQSAGAEANSDRITVASVLLPAQQEQQPPAKARVIACDDQGDDGLKHRVKVFLRGSPFVGTSTAAIIDKPLKIALQELVKPEKPNGVRSAYTYWSSIHRKVVREKNPDMGFADVSIELGAQWRAMGDDEKAPFMEKAELDRQRFAQEMQEYQDRLAFYNETLEFQSTHAPEAQGMVNQVVRLRPKPCKEARTQFINVLAQHSKEHPDVIKHCLAQRKITPEEVDEEAHEYFYVLTYIPDLLWCRLAPMHKAGTFTDKRFPRHLDRPRWTLIPEGAATEIDVSAARCEIVQSVAVKNSADADHEEWDILENTGFL